MCGIAAVAKLAGTACPAVVVDRMRDEAAHRGPDDQGTAFFARGGSVWADSQPEDGGWTVGLGHRRLSILDLSPAGRQPMVYRDRCWIVYNGEVYNFVELRRDLERRGHVFQSSSDTEVILAAYVEWGPSCFERFRGMWGLVILDRARNEILVSRDRLGIKPVYVWQGRGLVAIVSEIKQLRHVPGFTARTDRTAAAEYLRTGYEHLDRTLFREVRPLRAGTWQRIELDSLSVSAPVEYWHPERVKVSVHDVAEAGRLFAEKARECVAIHLRSDVPVGCALSGGLDSSAIAVIADSLKPPDGNPLHTFTSTFPGETIDERAYVDTVLARIDAAPHFVTPNAGLLLEELDRFLWVHDEPVGGLSMYAGYCVARLTREAGVPVTLNGQGGDEILGGYWQSYFLHLRNLWRRGSLLALARHFAGAAGGAGNPTLLAQISPVLRRYVARRRPLLAVRVNDDALAGGPAIFDEILSLDEQARRLYEIRSLHLPRLLKWDDRNSMAFSIEGRYPFLDHELIELCLSFAPDTLYHMGWTKRPLRVGLSRELPETLIGRRSKLGFATPQDGWLCGALRPALESWLMRDRPAWDFVNRQEVHRLADQVWRLDGQHEDPGLLLFRVFLFDRWLELFGLN